MNSCKAIIVAGHKLISNDTTASIMTGAVLVAVSQNGRAFGPILTLNSVGFLLSGPTPGGKPRDASYNLPGIQGTYSIPGPTQGKSPETPHITCLGYRGPILSPGPHRGKALRRLV